MSNMRNTLGTQVPYIAQLPPKPKHRTRRALLAIAASTGAVIIAVSVSAVIAGSNTPAPVTLPGSGTVTFTPEPATAPAAPAVPAVPAVPQFTTAQQQAIASAESYLQSEPGFSKLGLISQLHSPYGEGFSEKLAVFAVAHVKVNWFRQAVYAARSYMRNEPGWSYSGLVDQLHSPYGENFTLRQAEYAARKVGL
jgi:Host cell surface-exposed lipoprotein